MQTLSMTRKSSVLFDLSEFRLNASADNLCSNYQTRYQISRLALTLLCSSAFSFSMRAMMSAFSHGSSVSKCCSHVCVPGEISLTCALRLLQKRTNIPCELSNAKLAIRASCTLHNICKALRDNVDEQCMQDVYIFSELYKEPSYDLGAHTDEGEDARAPLAECFWKRTQWAS